MPVVTLLHTPPDEPLKSQLLQMVVDAFTDLSSTALPPSNALYNLYQYGLGFEVHLYLQALGSSRLPAELVLACAQGKVPCFEALGLAVEGVRDTQVLMASGAAAGDGVLVMLDVAPVWRTLEVQQIHSYLLKQHGRKSMVEAEKKRDRHLDELARHARAFVQERVGQMQEREIRLV